MKRWIAKVALRSNVGRFRRSPSAFDRILGRAVQLQARNLGEVEFCGEFHDFYRQLEPDQIKEEIGFPALAQRLDRPKGYKTEITSTPGRPAPGLLPSAVDPWARRFGLLRHIGIRADVLILRAGEQVPPHGHHRVVSGFYVLQGEVAARLYDRVQEVEGGVAVRNTVDEVLHAGAYTISSEHRNNIHWIVGMAPTSYLFRITAIGVPVETFGDGGRVSERIYVDPTACADGSGLIVARYIDEAEASRLVMTPAPEADKSEQLSESGLNRQVISQGASLA